jgi:hypothetical protein
LVLYPVALTSSSVNVASNVCSDCATYDVSANGSYTSTGTNLSLDNVYSKVTVRDSLYTVDSIIPSMFENEDLVNVKYDSSSNQMWNYEFEQRSFDFGMQRSSYDPHGSIWTSVGTAAEDDTYFCYPTKQNVITKIGFAVEEIYQYHLKQKK